MSSLPRGNSSATFGARFLTGADFSISSRPRRRTRSLPVASPMREWWPSAYSSAQRKAAADAAVADLPQSSAAPSRDQDVGAARFPHATVSS